MAHLRCPSDVCVVLAACNSLPLPLPCRDVASGQQATDWGWAWVLHRTALRQLPAVGRPQTLTLTYPLAQRFSFILSSEIPGCGNISGWGWKPWSAGTAWASFPKWSLPMAAYTQLLLLSGHASY